jgi:hypothetical protein
MGRLKLLILVVLVVAIAAPALAEPPRAFDREKPRVRPMIVDNSTTIDVNNIEMFVTNHGSFAYDLTVQDAGMWFPKGTDKTCVYASGFWVGAMVNDEVMITAGSFAQEYTPGPILSGCTWPDAGAAEHRVFKISKGDDATNPDYAEWPSDLGAPVDGEGRPLIIGDQTLWCVYNDADPEVHVTDEGSAADSPPLGIEIQQTTFAFDWKGALGNTIFIKFKVINKCDNEMEDTYFSVWCDPDLGGASDDYVGCDTDLSVGFVYNATNTDNLYGAQSPCVGYDFFQGPLDDEGNELPMVSFNKYINGTDPRTRYESYNYMQGLNLDGSPVVDPTTQDTVLFFLPGDPVEGTGWLDSDPADRRFMLNTGPFTMVPGDTQEVVVGIIVGQGNDRIGSIRVMKFFDQTAQVAFDRDFDLPAPPDKPEVNAVALDREIRLSWGIDSEMNPGDYTFEGYNVYQSGSISAAGPWKLISTYDLIDGVQTIEDLELNIEFGLPLMQPVQFGKDLGLRRYEELGMDEVKSVPLANGTPYYYRIGAYSYTDEPLEGLPKTLESLSDIIRVIPQEPVAGTVLTDFASEPVHGVEGTVDPSTEVLEIEVVDPFALTGHDYKLVYEESDPPDELWMFNNSILFFFDYHWKIIDETTGETVFEYGVNRNGDDDYPVVDGFVPRVIMGIPIGAVRYQLADGTPSDALQGGDFHATFHINDQHAAGIWYGQDFFGSTISVKDNFDDYHNVELRFGETQKGYRYDRPGYAFTGIFDMPFTVWDTDENRQLNVCWVEWLDGDIYDGIWLPDASAIGGREYLFIMNSDYDPDSLYNDENWGPGGDVLFGCWLRRESDSAVLEDGSVLKFVKAVASKDTDFFTFSTTAPDYDAGLAKSALDDVRVVPNPYFAKSTYEIDQFHHVIKFSNLPEKCTIRIFNLAGDLIRTLEKDDASTSILEWNLYNEKEIPVASGFYLFHVDAPGVGSKYGRFAVFLEKERLNTF